MTLIFDSKKTTVFFAVIFALILTKANAQTLGGVVFSNCPTLLPSGIPVVNFMPGAMAPIELTEATFEAGMNVTIKSAVTAASLKQTKAVNDTFNMMVENFIKIERAQHEQEIEINRQFARLRQAYESHLAQQLERADNIAFPGDPAMMPSIDGSPSLVSSSSPTMKFARQMCTTAKMNQKINSIRVKDDHARVVNRRNQKLIHNIQAVSNVQSVAKRTVDKHYDLFCSEEDMNNDLCDTPSAAPNADLSAFVFLYPTGFDDQPECSGIPYRTLYTYSPVESLAAYNYMQHVTGSLYHTPPSEAELSSSSSAEFVSLYRQAKTSLSMSMDVMLEIAQNREPLNNEGAPMSVMDVLGCQLSTNVSPEHRRLMRTSSDNGKLLEIQRQMALNNQIRFLLLQQKDAQRRILAADLSLENSMNHLGQ